MNNRRKQRKKLDCILFFNNFVGVAVTDSLHLFWVIERAEYCFKSLYQMALLFFIFVEFFDLTVDRIVNSNPTEFFSDFKKLFHTKS